MRLIFGMIIGAALMVGGAYVADAMAGTEAMAGHSRTTQIQERYDREKTNFYPADSSRSRRRRGHNCQRRFHPREVHLTSRMTKMLVPWLIEAHRSSA